MAPPITLASAKQNSFCVGCLYSCQMMKRLATVPIPVNNQRCHPPAFERKEKAAPVLWARTMLKKFVMVVASPHW